MKTSAQPVVFSEFCELLVLLKKLLIFFMPADCLLICWAFFSAAASRAFMRAMAFASSCTYTQVFDLLGILALHLHTDENNATPLPTDSIPGCLIRYLRDSRASTIDAIMLARGGQGGFTFTKLLMSFLSSLARLAFCVLAGRFPLDGVLLWVTSIRGITACSAAAGKSTTSCTLT